ncbi:MAG: site-specific integrase [Opitutaceae bacterium]
MQVEAGMCPILTTLTKSQVRDAELAFRRLGNTTQPLSFYVELALANYRETQHDEKLSEAIAAYVAAKQHEQDQALLSKLQCVRIRQDLERLDEFFPGALVVELTGPLLMGFFERGMPSSKTYNNRRGIVSTFLKYAFQKGWLEKNPLARIPARRIRRNRSSAHTLTAASAAEMMHWLETFEDGCWIPFFALTLFAGIRPSVPQGEITRLKPEHIDLEAGIISISPEVSKVHEARKVTIQPNLAAWLRAYPLNKFCLIVSDFANRRAALSKQFALTHDVLRHTFISMFVAKYRSIGEAAIQAGNSESIIRRHYLDLKTPAEGEAFFAILPKHGRVADDPCLVGPLTSAPAAEQRPAV